MDIKQAVEDLQKCDSELGTLNRLKKLRRVLRFILIGFLIRKDADRRTSELMTKKSLIIRSIEVRLEEIETAHRQIKEISRSGTLLNEVQQKQWMPILGSLSQDFAVLKEKTKAYKTEHRIFRDGYWRSYEVGNEVWEFYLPLTVHKTLIVEEAVKEKPEKKSLEESYEDFQIEDEDDYTDQ
jgi:hypothetical protein